MDYFARAMLEAVLAGALAGLVGVLVVLRNRAFFTMSLTHATFPGAVVAALVGIPVPAGAAVASVALVGVATAIGRIRSQGSAVASGIMLTAGFALGSLLQSVAPSGVDVESFLVGSILATDSTTLSITAAVLVAVVVAGMLRSRQLLFATFDRDGYAAAGLQPWRMEALSLAMIAATVVAIMPAVGAILGVALIVAPAAAARLVTRSVAGMLVVAPVVGVASGVLGLLVSRSLGVSPGGSITLIAALAFVAALAASSLRRRSRAGAATVAAS